ncbi:MAG: phosphate transport system regulatory protein PhoU [Planctomycetota bacterium]|nr:MAG: phosphate transport system regulatory protein PhoU [Planctomycetota bacterium]
MADAPAQSTEPSPGRRTSFDEGLDNLQRTLQREASLAVQQVHEAVQALRELDREKAKAVRRRDDEVDKREVRIEEDCIRLIALHQPVASDLRRVMAAVRINADLERIADHASGVCKSVLHLDEAEAPPVWPAALLEMANRIVPRCRRMQFLLSDPDETSAKALVDEDEALDALTTRAFQEIEQAMVEGTLTHRAGLLAFRALRDLERIGDLCSDICEDLIYLQTGSIVRHSVG